MSNPWHLPYTWHNFTTEEFLKLKADYVAKYGYTVYLPGWEDIVHIKLEEGFTEDEEIRWHKKDWNSFTPARLDYLKGIKEKRRRDYLRMLGSPQPNILKNRGTLLTSLDDNQDALTTLTFLFQIMYSVLPLVWRTWLTGPVGWMMTASDVLNLCTRVITPETSAIRQKRIKDKITDKNPFSKKARGRKRIRLYKGQISGGAGFEIMQTSDMLFGYGITLGALMNLPLDMYYGRARVLEGAEVRLATPMEAPAFWKNQASAGWKSLCTLFTTDQIWRYTEVSSMLLLSHLTAIAMHILAPTLDPNNAILDVELYAAKALEPKKSYLREIMEENGDDPDGFTGWPLTDEKYSSCVRLHTEGAPIATRNFQDYCSTNRYNLEAFYCAQRAVDAGFFMLAAATGDDSIEYDYIATEKTTHALLNAGYRFPYTLTLPSGWWTRADVIESALRLGFPQPNNFQTLDEEKISPLDTLQSIKDEADPVWASQAARWPMYPGIERDLSRLEVPWIVYGKPWMYESYQRAKYFPDPLLGVPTLQPRGELPPMIMSRLVRYLEDHEKNGTSPSLPDFLRWSKDNLGVTYPVNETPSESSILPEILPPPEIP